MADDDDDEGRIVSYEEAKRRQRSEDKGGNGHGGGHGGEPPVFIAPSRGDLAQFDERELPVRQWAVPDLIPRGEVGLCSGHGGTGKSRLMLHLAVAHVLGRDWLRHVAERGPVIYLGAESTLDDLVLMIDPARRLFEAMWAHLVDLHVIAMAGQQALLAALDPGRVLVPTPLFEWLCRLASDVKPMHIIVENSADAFPGSEIDRTQVRQFMNLLKRLALVSNAAVTLISHPSLTGMASGSGLSGSTGWHNSARYRFVLRTASKEGEGDADPDPGARELEIAKSQYGPSLPAIELRWKDGLFLPVPRPTPLTQAMTDRGLKMTFLDLLDKYEGRGQPVSDRPKANNYAPSVFSQDPALTTSVKSMARAMGLLLDAGEIKIVPYGFPSRGWTKLIRSTAVQP